MVPVSLRLRNFLSYGEAAEPLDFEAFSVACLSGGNGQGKSALLDALTWAVWGEARKSSGAQKPDEELLRIGTRDMEVEFVFDLDEARYRIVRSYHRSASGKTSKPGLEFHLYDSEADAFRTLTAESVRATQAAIHSRVGLDYDTFINSAFLLQGRSDEFTKKKPGERKEILGKILGLDRYERLAARAGQRYSAAREQVKRLEETVERLKAAVAEEAAWQSEHDETASAVARLEAERDVLRAKESELGERLAALDAVAREAEAHRAALRRLTERRERLEAEHVELGRRIEEAQALVARKETVERDHARYEALMEERGHLDERAELKRGVEHQLQTLRLDLEKRRMDLEGRIKTLEAEIAGERKVLDEDERRLTVELPRAKEAFAQARAAAEEHAALRERYAARQQRLDRVAALDKRIEGERNRLEGRKTSLQKQLQQALSGVETVAVLREEEGRLHASVSEAERWRVEQERVREEGTDVKAQLGAAEAERDRLRAEITAVEAKRNRLAALEDDACPTCGTALTDVHRREVEATYAREKETLEQRLATQERTLADLAARRDDLRRAFLDLRGRLDQKNGVATKLAQLQQRIEQVAEGEAALAELDIVLDEGRFLEAERAERTQIQEELDAEPFDEARYEAVRVEAARLGERRQKLEELGEIEARRDERRRQLTRREDDLGRLRTDLEAGTSLAPVRTQIGALEQQLATVGYDGARHEAVRRELEMLKEAPQTFMQLLEAQRNLTEWTQRRSALGEEEQTLTRERQTHEEALAAVEAKLGDREALAAALTDAATKRAEAEATLSTAQSRLGGLREKLDRCARDRGTLKETRAELREAKRQSALYRHLRGAFGRHGIPSLIIEETLPEVEERTNALLERLSNGRTRVALETLKDKKTGGTKETLDIRITDEQGVARSYETFSGGEAFRVNFALRIALAQLLAERSGVRIRTLVVDEGFGTQDKAGIQNLVEAIRTIQDDFDKILVITHLDELKDAFPIRIEVTKQPVVGSTFEIVGV